jgi:hypothetical protein
MNCTSKTGLQNPRQHRHECNDLLVKGFNMNAIWYSMPPLTICYTRPGLRRCVLGEQISEVENKICMDSKATRCMYVLQIPSACTSPHPNASRKVKKKTPLNAQQMITPSRQCKHPVLESPAAFADSRAAPTDRELLLGHVGMLSRPFLDIEAQRTPTHARFFCDLAICQIAVFA